MLHSGETRRSRCETIRLTGSGDGVGIAESRFLSEEPMTNPDQPVLMAAKRIVWPYAASPCHHDRHLSERVQYYGPAPIGLLSGKGAVAGFLDGTLARVFPAAEKKPYLYFGDIFDGSAWIGATGNIKGRMASSWLGIPAADGTHALRFGEFYKVEDERIVEVRCILDIPGLAAQAGIEILPRSRGKAAIPGGPAPSVGIRVGASDPEDTNLTRSLVEEMITGGCNKLEGTDLASQGLERFWHPEMAWHGPWGVGSSFGLDEFYRFAQGPSVRSFPGRRGSWPKVAFLADGEAAGFVGWPGLIGEFTGEPFLGMPPTGGPISQNVMDFYVRRGGKLLENWVLIDLIEFASGCGVDLLARIAERQAR